jgi:hypothetical protein
MRLIERLAGPGCISLAVHSNPSGLSLQALHHEETTGNYL